MKRLLYLAKNEMDESRFAVVRQVLEGQCTGQGGEKITLGQHVSRSTRGFDAMSVVLTVIRHVLTSGVSTTMCENFFSTSKSIFSEHRRSVSHRRQANLIKLTFENGLSRKFKEEWKDLLLGVFSRLNERYIENVFMFWTARLVEEQLCIVEYGRGIFVVLAYCLYH